MKNLKDYRKEIDKIDKGIIQRISKRFLVTKEVAKFKKENNLTAKDSGREKLMFLERKKWAQEFGINGELIDAIFKEIIKNTVKNHKKIMEEK